MTTILSVCYAESADETIPLPRYETEGSAGMDLYANFPTSLRKSGVMVKPGGIEKIPTGLIVAMPYDMEATARPRSGLAIKHGITVLNTPGTIDADYRDEWSVIIINHGKKDFHIKHGKRFAQVVFSPIIRPHLNIVSAQDMPRPRGLGGFGSTGTK